MHKFIKSIVAPKLNVPHCVIPLLAYQPSAVIIWSVSASQNHILFNVYLSFLIIIWDLHCLECAESAIERPNGNGIRLEQCAGVRCVNECDQIRMEKEVSNFWIRDYCYYSVDLTAFENSFSPSAINPMCLSCDFHRFILSSTHTKCLVINFS